MSLQLLHIPSVQGSNDARKAVALVALAKLPLSLSSLDPAFYNEKHICKLFLVQILAHHLESQCLMSTVACFFIAT